MKFTTLATLASSLAPASAYLVTGDPLNCRSGPGTSYAVKKTYPKDTDISITCQTAGPSINGNAVWDKTSDGCYVSDYYVKTGVSGYVTDKCGSATTCDAPSANQATVNLIAEFEGFVDHVCTHSHPFFSHPNTALTFYSHQTLTTSAIPQSATATCATTPSAPASSIPSHSLTPTARDSSPTT